MAATTPLLVAPAFRFPPGPRRAVASALDVAALLLPFLQPLFDDARVEQRNPLARPEALTPRTRRVLAAAGSGPGAAAAAGAADAMLAAASEGRARSKLSEGLPRPPWMLDAVLLVGGYEASDFTSLALPRLVAQLGERQLIDSGDDNYRQLIFSQRRRKGKYLNQAELEHAMARNRVSSHVRMLRDCFAVVLDGPTPPVAAVAARAGLSAAFLSGGGCAADDRDHRQPQHFYFGLGNPDATPSVLRTTLGDAPRLMLRPQFGFSQDLLAACLPLVVVEAAEAAATFVRTALSLRVGLPPLFWLQAAATAYGRRSGVAPFDVAMRGGASADAPAAAETTPSKDEVVGLANETVALVWSVVDPATATEQEPSPSGGVDLFANHFLASERFDSLSDVKRFVHRLERMRQDSDGVLRPPQLGLQDW